MNIAMIPARMGSQRLKQKNLRELAGVPLITRAIRKCRAAGVFDEIWVNSEHDAFGDIAREEGVGFHKRPEELANNVFRTVWKLAVFRLALLACPHQLVRRSRESEMPS